MRFHHPKHEGRRVRLAYCQNLHAASETLEGCLEGIRRITLPLRDALAPEGGRFGIGMYLPAAVALPLASADGAAELEELAAFLEEERLDPFTFNAFPYGGFHDFGLKERVFEPTWCEEARVEYTLAVARVAARLNRGERGHVSISTHPGRYGAFEAGELELAAENLGGVVLELAKLEEAGGPRVVLGLEAEPRACAGDTSQLAIQHYRMRAHLAGAVGPELLDRHLGNCLDTCHTAVEFERAGEAVELSTRAPLAKCQLASAITTLSPGKNVEAREGLLALDEPRFLHQTTGRLRPDFPRSSDLSELRAALAEEGSAWLRCDQWRTHFHVPIDLGDLDVPGLTTTREHTREALVLLLTAPARWPGEELHLEIETYTWEILPRAARAPGELVEGLRAEYEEALTGLRLAGWTREGS